MHSASRVDLKRVSYGSHRYVEIVGNSASIASTWRHIRARNRTSPGAALVQNLLVRESQFITDYLACGVSVAKEPGSPSFCENTDTSETRFLSHSDESVVGIEPLG